MKLDNKQTKYNTNNSQYEIQSYYNNIRLWIVINARILIGLMLDRKHLCFIIQNAYINMFKIIV